MFDELAVDLLDLTATEKGYGRALYAANEDEKCSSIACTVILCCSIHICW